MDQDAVRTALLVAPELAREPSIEPPIARRLAPPIPGPATRLAQLILSKREPLELTRRSLAPSIAARRAMLGEHAEGPPRFLIRVDEFPYATSLEHPEYGVEPSTHFHSVLADAGVPYLMAIVPRLVHEPLDPKGAGGRELDAAEHELLRRMADDGVELGAHGLTHRTRYASPRRRSEFLGLSGADAGQIADQSIALLSAMGIKPRVFVPPFNRIAAAHYDALASRFDVVCGGPETILYLGAQPTPRWLGSAIYCPSYFPLYGTAKEAYPETQRLIEARPGTWIPLALHLAWEVDDRFEGLKRLADLVSPYAAPWGDFLDAAERSRASGTPTVSAETP